MKIRDRIKELLWIQASDLIPNPSNWRRHPKQQSSALMGVLREVGFAGATLVRKVGSQYMLIDGHLRAELMGKEKIPVLVTDLTEEEADKILATLDPIGALATRDNAALQELLASITAHNDDLRGLLEKLGKAPAGGLSDADEPTEPVKNHGVKHGDLFQLGEHRLMCGDSTRPEEVQTLLAGESPMLMTTDPPYGVEYDASWRAASGFGSKRHGKVSNDDRADWSSAWALFPGDVAYVWHGALHASVVHASLLSQGFEIRAQIIWAKHRSPISRGAYRWQHEPCWYAVRNGGKASWNGDHSQTTVWSPISDPADASGSDHSTQKPVELFRRPIQNHTESHGVIYDPFIGSGTAIIAAEQLGRRCFAMEISPEYVAAAIRRWENFTGKKAVRPSRNGGKKVQDAA